MTTTFRTLSAILTALLILFFTPMLLFSLTASGELWPLTLFFLPIVIFLLWSAHTLPDRLTQRPKLVLTALFAALLLMCQLTLARALYGNIAYDFNPVYAAGQSLARTGTIGESPTYFARFPNNLLLAYIFAFLIKLSDLIGYPNLMAVLTGCSLLSVDLSILLMGLCARKAMGERAALTALLLAVPLAVLHYGIVCPYSDTFCMAFPMLILFLYLHLPESTGRACAAAALMGLLSAIGYKIKPQTVIIAIAIGLVELFYHKPGKARVIKLLRLVGSFLLALIISASCLNLALERATAASITPELRESLGTPPTHYLMMGLNPETGGFYSGEDYNATNSLPTQREKVACNLKTSAERLAQMGPVGYAKFLLRKGRRTFQSAYMDMWVRAPFASTDPLSSALQDNFCQIAPALQDNLPGRGGYAVYLQFLQALWVLQLGLWVVPAALSKGSRADKFTVLLRLTVMGLAAFQLLFEGGARYRFHQTPVFILLAVRGMMSLPEGVKAVRELLGRIKPASLPKIAS